MTPAFAILALCLSPTESLTILRDHRPPSHVTVAYRSPAHCAPKANLAKDQDRVPQEASRRPVEAKVAPRATTTPAKKAKKPATAKRRKADGCKPGRHRNSRGICGRW